MLPQNNRPQTPFERDAESALDHTWFRQYSSAQARWLSPDPLGGDISNPQSLNRYSYVLNNPINYVDPLGLFCVRTFLGVDYIDSTSTIRGSCAAGSSPGVWYDDPYARVTVSDTGSWGTFFNPGGGCLDVYLDGVFTHNTCWTNGPVGGDGSGGGGILEGVFQAYVTARDANTCAVRNAHSIAAAVGANPNSMLGGVLSNDVASLTNLVFGTNAGNAIVDTTLKTGQETADALFTIAANGVPAAAGRSAIPAIPLARAGVVQLGRAALSFVSLVKLGSDVQAYYITLYQCSTGQVN